ncbi:Rrf2 family protein [Paenibacillus phyllosphaerae]|uniref:Rrf2 family protein n=1 Tax=Paenibacillus phyllosphaerae TaxID=274593 RepID=A0A7W5FR09_9BACL|nr:Rrf2 family transcriptional regulator [Paenibacillus phyllosphaerae]MBB3113863.1 Rrf2 family protein [Paenibacillus phyllosphaerae]
MKTNKSSQIGPPRFRIAVHILVQLAQGGTFLSSASIACAVNSHATFLRRILASLAQAGIVEAKEGREGGYGLKLPADQITLGEVYLALRSEETECKESNNEDCAQAEKIDHILGTIIEQADQQTIAYLRKYTIQDMMYSLK